MINDDHCLLRKSDFNSDSVLVKSFPDADKAGSSGIFVNQDSNDDSIKSTVKVFDERRENTIDVEEPDPKQADNTSTSDPAEDCAEDEWSCHMKGKHIFGSGRSSRSHVVCLPVRVSHLALREHSETAQKASREQSESVGALNTSSC